MTKKIENDEKLEKEVKAGIEEVKKAIEDAKKNVTDIEAELEEEKKKE